MGKIQPLICPQCGSTNAVSLGDDKYQCQSCQTIYFIDKEKVEVHVKHYLDTFDLLPGERLSPPPAKKKNIIAAALLVLAFATFVVFRLVTVRNAQTEKSNGVYGTENFDIHEGGLMTVSSGAPKIFVIAESRIRGDGNNVDIVLKTYEPSGKTLVKRAAVISNISREEYGKGDYGKHSLYLIGDRIWYLSSNSRIFEIDPNSSEIKNTNAGLSAQFKELTAGIGTIEKLFGENGFKIQNNNGENYFYFPLEKKIYSQTEYQKLRDGIVAEGKLTKRFTFQGADELKKLYEIEILENEKAPGRICDECLDNDALAKGVKLPPDNKNIKEVKEFTAGRKYFSGKVLYNDDNNLLINFNLTADQNDSPTVQNLNAENGETKWTVKTDALFKRKSNLVKVLKSGGSFLIFGYYEGLAVDENGKVLWSYDVLDRDEWKDLD